MSPGEKMNSSNPRRILNNTTEEVLQQSPVPIPVVSICRVILIPIFVIAITLRNPIRISTINPRNHEVNLCHLSNPFIQMAVIA